MGNQNNTINNFNGAINVNGDLQIASGDINNNNLEDSNLKVDYTVEPVWRSPITIAVLTWLSLGLTICGLLPIGIIAENVIMFFSGGTSKFENLNLYYMIFTFNMVLLIGILNLRDIVKKEVRKPIKNNLAINGYGKRITIEKIHPAKCPFCGGNMKYYNKPIDYIDKLTSEGKLKREVSKRSPALACLRNSEHFIILDPTDSEIN